MGVKGLLPLLRSIHKPCSLKQFAGQTLGIDAYGWLHRGTISCAIELAQGKPTTKFVDFAMTRVRMLQHFGVTPLLVFDGDYLPSKKDTEKDRAAKRRDAKAAGLELLQMGRHSLAYQELQKGIDVTPEMARQLMDELDKAKVRFIVAPYEADSQLVYLEKKGIVHGIISEDSDMLVFGAKVLLTKLDQYGECIAIHRKDFTACTEISMVGWTDKEFRIMSILSGCDYLAPVGNVGLKTAYRLIRKHNTVDRIVKALQFDGKSKIPPGYLDNFRAAELTFLYQWVYCPDTQQLVNITELRDGLDLDSMPYLGQKTPADIAHKIAHGKIHPHTKQPLFAPTLPQPRHFKTLERALQERTPQLKKHQSIESFFKPKRTPLAELDPNLFTPSPSQQRLLEQQQQEIVTTTAPPAVRPPALVRAATDRTQHARRAVAESTSAAAQTSPKRQRLCSDSADRLPPNSSAKVHSGQSRFFAKPNSFQSPSALKAGRIIKAKKKDFSVWSDDSIEDAFNELESASALTSTEDKGRRKVFRDEVQPKKEKDIESQSSIETQSTVASVELPDFSQADRASTVLLKSFGAPSATSQEEPTASIELPDFSQADRASAVLLKSFGAPSTCSQREKPASVVVVEAVASKEQKPPSSLSVSSQGARTAYVDVVPCSSPPEAEDAITEEDWADAAKMPIKLLPVAKEFAVFSGGRAERGSEDLFISHSDSENEDGIGNASLGLNLGRFAFAG